MFEKFKKEKTHYIRNKVEKREEHNDSSVICPYNNDNPDIIRPIVFTTIGNYRSAELIEFPLIFSKSANCYIAKNADNMLYPIIESELIRKLDFTNNIIIRDNLTTYIVQNSFMNICSALNSSKYSNYFSIIPVLPYIEKELLNNYIDISMTISNYINSVSTKYIGTEFEEKIIDQSIAYLKNISMQISQFICRDICKGADKAITEVGMQVHVVPRINELYRDLINNFDTLAQLKQKSPNDVATFCTILLKKLFREIVEEVMFNTINKDIEYILLNVVNTLYFNYNDYLYYDFNAAREQLLNTFKNNMKGKK